VKREGDIATVRAIEKSIKQYGKYKLLKDGGAEHEYDGIGYAGKSAKFSRRYRIYCSTFHVLRGFIDILLIFDCRVNEGRVVIKNELAGLFCKIVPHTGEHMWRLKRYFSCNNRRNK